MSSGGGNLNWVEPDHGSTEPGNPSRDDGLSDVGAHRERNTLERLGLTPRR
jgi:hypothetical protein